jgi:hypothetical protein
MVPECTYVHNHAQQSAIVHGEERVNTGQFHTSQMYRK